MHTWKYLLVWAALAAAASAGVQERTTVYRDGDTELEGRFFWDDQQAGARPGVIVFHQWAGPTDHEFTSARRLAGLGYAVLVADVYGKGVRPATTEARMAEVTKYKGDRALLQRRTQSALAALTAQPEADAARVAALGYCFGGTAALELARAGAEVDGVISFHGGLGTPHPEQARRIKARVLALHGADDPWVPEAEVKSFAEEMRAAGVDWQLVSYGGAVHAFTQPEAGNDPKAGAAYHEPSARRSWTALLAFLRELFPTR